MATAVTRPWQELPIRDCGEPLVDLPPDLLRLEPHPYRSLGAPYPAGGNPFRLRRGVVACLLRGQEWLRRQDSDLRLAIFDGWRPLAVQRFMVEHAYTGACRARGLDPAGTGSEQRRVAEEVARFWAPPSEDRRTPPPHSTGAAVDLTLADAAGRPLAMGGEIDEIGPVSEPDHHGPAAGRDPGSAAALWHRRRSLLHEALEQAGMVRHPHEWWHFSHGDQLWAWSSGRPAAIYGRVPD